RMDAAAHAYTSRGVNLALQLMNAPGWAIHSKYKNVDKNAWRYPREEVHQRAYISALLQRYGEHTQFVQIFNEPDQTRFWSGQPEEFVSQFQYSRDEIQKYAGEKSLPIVNGGYSLFEKEKTAYFAEQLKGQLDMVAYHCHGDLNALIEDFSFVKKLHEKSGYENPRFVNTEMGFDGWRLDQELRKGQFVPQKTLYCWATGHAGALLFGSRMTLGPNRRSQDFGFLDHYFCPRYVYGSVAAMVSELAGASFDSVLLEEDNRFVYQFTREDKRIVAAFTLDQTAEIKIACDATAAIQIDAMGNREKIETPGTVHMKLSNYPVYLEWTNAGAAAVVTLQ
ncbi:MAG: hypothetical protein P1V20_30415, partial [Verrucomicrobiales bacterium]|nr:hypothetical protein [Verrucomicrobiales bacterium]